MISDEIQVFSSGVLGLTIQCAQCHDHKLEPIPQRDYYRLRAVFKGALDEYDWMVPNDGVKDKPARLLPYVAPPQTPSRWRKQQKIKPDDEYEIVCRDQSSERGAQGTGETVGERDYRGESGHAARGIA